MPQSRSNRSLLRDFPTFPLFDPDHIRDLPRVERAFEGVLEALERSAKLSVRDANTLLLRSTAELRYQLHGGAKCQLCCAHVRHVLYVTCQYAENLSRVFHSLCTRCLVAEEAVAQSVALSFWPPEGEELQQAA